MEEYAFDQASPSYPQAKTLHAGGGDVARELGRQGAVLEQLHATISELDMRTQAIRLGKPERAPEPDVPHSVRSEIGNEIAARTDAIEQATRRLSVILQELEV